MQFMSSHARAPPPPPRFAAIAPLPLEDQGHYLRRSGSRWSESQSESSVADKSDPNESDDELTSSAGSDSDSDASDASSDASSASLSSRSASVSSLDGSEVSSDEYEYQYEEQEYDDGDPVLRIHDASTAMRVQHPSDNASWHSDNLGVLALLIPITGVATMVLTEVLACAHHFDCTNEYPTLSYAAEFKPEGHAFTLGMCLTSIFILASVALFHWFLRLKLVHPQTDRRTVVTVHSCLVAGAIAAASLFGLAVFDMGAYHDTHITFTVLFFIFAWVTMVAVQAARRLLLKDETNRLEKKTTTTPCSNLSTARLWLQRWKRISVHRAYQLGQLFLCAGLTATGLFALLFLCVNGVWPNPFGFTAVQEALLEAFAIFCQLFFMGTLSCELSKLTRVVEHRDYEELERAE